jgi:thiol-disulfide isomerase/thioredoxin
MAADPRVPARALTTLKDPVKLGRSAYLFMALLLCGSASMSGEREAPSLRHAGGWLNSKPLGLAELRGKVVLVDFWTYTCINWRRTLPWVRAWAEKYRDSGLVVVGVHTPEFSFEAEVENVRREAQAQGVNYPIALDSNYAVWHAYDNHYWPALYLIDARGRIRHQQFGEGGYEQVESLIRQLLTEAGSGSLPQAAGTVEGQGAEAAADWKDLRSPETYLGRGRAEGFAATSLRLVGSWSREEEFARATAAGSRIVYRFHARDLHLVMGPGAGGKALRYRVSIDGRPPGDAHGMDVDAQGQGVIDSPRMYQLIRQREPIESRTFEIEFLDPGAQAFVFTFG